ncbi:fungal-specific actin related protein [Auriscalpium vulgare]|uniref:Fungal-specific actin related protein n=1 Tax=Auriscalpium vulgare TaxID=40419 RepID=A0ACB8RVA8_9AGAM|nr:fungal-specific actin related protein [Auriscalpium vulgare]
MSVPATPRKPSHAASVAATPATSRAANAHVVQASPHYQTTRRHSLYGTEDRVVIDPGSRVWKVGFSGEGRPRDVFSVGSLWGLRRAAEATERDEEDRVLEARLQAYLRDVFHDSLLTDPKSRKVIIVEHPLLPLYVKEMLAKILFGNLQAPSISFASSHLLALLSVGRITGLVLDCGNLESTVLPIFASRPLYPQLRTTPLAGARFTAHLCALLLLFGTYLPPPTSLSAAANIPVATRSMRVPQEVLTEAVLEEIKTRCSFVGEPLDPSSDMRVMSPSGGDDSMEIDLPPSDTAPSESDFSRVSADLESNVESQPASSGFSIVSRSQIAPERPTRGEGHLQALASMYTRHSTATDLHIKVVPPVAQQAGTGKGTLIIPGWIRERAAEVLFEGGDVDESSVAETVLDSLLKVPVDLRKTLASSILVIGGTAMLPGFIPRLHAELLRAIASSPSSAARPPMRPDRPRPPAYDRYAVLRPLVPHFAILNNPSPPAQPTGARGSANAGKAPAFTPAAMAWVGGSLAGSLKTGGAEVPREKWDEAEAQQDPDDSANFNIDLTHHATPNVIPDWTRSPLPIGAPPANPPPPIPEASPRAAVGA